MIIKHGHEINKKPWPCINIVGSYDIFKQCVQLDIDIVEVEF